MLRSKDLKTKNALERARVAPFIHSHRCRVCGSWSPVDRLVHEHKRGPKPKE